VISARGAMPRFRARLDHIALGLEYLRVVELTREADAHRVVGRAETGPCPRRAPPGALPASPGPLRQVLGQGDEVGHAVIAEDKRQPLVGIPAVEVDGLREIAIAPQQHAAEAALQADGDGLVHLHARRT